MKTSSFKYFFAAAAFIPLTLFKPPSGAWPSSAQIRIGKGDCNTGPIFKVKVAQTSDARSKRLSHRKKELSEQEGMLFILNEHTTGYFWMKDTFIPLSLIFFDGKGKYLSGSEMPVETNPSEPIHRYPIPPGTQLALEVAPGNTQALTAATSPVLCVQK